MKRPSILIAVVILLLLIGGGVLYFLFFSKPKGPTTAAEMVPASSSFFLWLPQVPKSLEKFKATPAYSLWKDQAVQAALNKLNPLENPSIPLGSPDSAKKIKTIWELTGPLFNTFQGEAFLAVTAVEMEPKVNIDVVGGFQTGPDPSVFLTWTNQVKSAFPDLKWEEKTHPSQKYYSTETTIDSQKVTLCVAQWRDWVLIGTGEQAFLQLLNQVHGGKPDPALCLSGQPSYLKFLARQPQGFDALTYINPAPLVATAKKAMEKKAPEQLDTLKPYEAIEAIMLTTIIDGPDFKDRAMLQSPKGKRLDPGAAALPLKGSTTRFTTPQTLAYFAQNVDLVSQLAQMRSAGADETKMINDGITKVNEALGGVQLDLEKDVLPKFGPELAFILDWAQGKPFPDFTIALEHKDQAMVRKLTDFLMLMATSMGGGKVPIKPGDLSGDPTYTVEIPMSPLAPAIWIGKDMALFTFNGAGLENMVKRTGSGLLDTEPYKKLAARSEIKNPSSLAYLDVENLVVFSHGALSNLLPMVANLAGNPGLAQTLPPVDTIKPYLGRWLTLSQVDDNGVFAEGIYEKGHPLIYAVTGAALIADLVKAVVPLALQAIKPAPPQNTKSADSEVDAALVMQDLVDLDDGISSWAKDKNKPAGTTIAWNDIVSYIQENSQVVTRVGLDPLGNAYILGKIGPDQVILSAATQEYFEGKVPKGFWGKFTNKPGGELPTP